ncbi:unnamed protein product, partial [Lymnaea stagnalis]
YSHQTGLTEVALTNAGKSSSPLKVPQHEDGSIVARVNKTNDIITGQLVDTPLSSDSKTRSDDDTLNRFTLVNEMKTAPDQLVSKHQRSDFVHVQFNSMHQEDGKEESDDDYSDIDDNEDDMQRDISKIHPVSSDPSTSNNSTLPQPSNSLQTTPKPSASKKSMLSLTQQKEALLSLLKRQNGTSGSQTSDPLGSQCKILTKYVFINKSSQCKSGKKRFGVLYKNAFRHFHRSKPILKSHEKHGPKTN